MKKIIVLITVIATLVSCGKDKKNFEKEVVKNTAVSLELAGTFAKNDSLAVFYKTDGYYHYDKPVTRTIKGSDLAQKITFEIPQGIAPENLIVIASTNKEQEKLIITEITIKNGDDIIDGQNFKYFDYFVADNSFTLDQNTKVYTLSHANKYPPAIAGTEKLEALLVK